MDPLTIAALAEQGLAIALQIYNQIKHANPSIPMRAVADIIAEADANFAKAGQIADAEIAS